MPDVKYVIDFCLTKCQYCDDITGYTELRREWATKSSMDQRKGRAGRVSTGFCFRLITEQFYESLQDHPTPAVKRQPIDKLILNAKRIRPDSPPAVIYPSVI